MLDSEKTLPGRALAVESRRTLGGLADELASLELRPPGTAGDYWPAARTFAHTTLADWATGRYGNAGPAVRRRTGRMVD